VCLAPDTYRDWDWFIINKCKMLRYYEKHKIILKASILSPSKYC
jgi:hypothetical protein